MDDDELVAPKVILTPKELLHIGLRLVHYTEDRINRVKKAAQTQNDLRSTLVAIKLLLLVFLKICKPVSMRISESRRIKSALNTCFRHCISSTFIQPSINANLCLICLQKPCAVGCGIRAVPMITRMSVRIFLC